MDRLSPTVYFSAKVGIIKTKSATIVFFSLLLLFSAFWLFLFLLSSV